MYQCSKKLVKYKEYSCFDHSDFPAHSMFTFDVCWGSLGTSIFGNSSLAANNTQSRLPSRISFRFLWLWVIAQIFNPTAELAIPTGTLTNEANAEIETLPLTAEMKTIKCLV